MHQSLRRKIANLEEERGRHDRRSSWPAFRALCMDTGSDPLGTALLTEMAEASMGFHATDHAALTAMSECLMLRHRVLQSRRLD